jgi:uncharacterized membrane protein YvlD (DUF360 family)
MFKKLFRMIVFSGIALILTSLIIRGFKPDMSLQPFLLTACALGIFYYVINPLFRIILLPVNLLTLGFISFIVYILLFAFVVNRFGFVIIEPWVFIGGNFFGFLIPTIESNYFLTLVSSSLLYSFFINVLEFLL